jgi:hypothetical protein
MQLEDLDTSVRRCQLLRGAQRATVVGSFAETAGNAKNRQLGAHA